MPDQLTQEQTQEIANALTGGRKIEAIRIYRAATGKGLKDAKDFVDALIPELIEKDPETYKALARPQGAGCASAFVAVLALGGTAALLAKALA